MKSPSVFLYFINSFLFVILLTSIKVMEDYLKLCIWEWLNTIFAMVTIIINMANNNNPAGALIPLLPFEHRNETAHSFSSFYAVPMRVCKVDGLVGFYNAGLSRLIKIDTYLDVCVFMIYINL